MATMKGSRTRDKVGGKEHNVRHFGNGGRGTLGGCCREREEVSGK